MIRPAFEARHFLVVAAGAVGAASLAALGWQVVELRSRARALELIIIDIHFERALAACNKEAEAEKEDERFDRTKSRKTADLHLWYAPGSGAEMADLRLMGRDRYCLFSESTGATLMYRLDR